MIKLPNGIMTETPYAIYDRKLSKYVKFEDKNGAIETVSLLNAKLNKVDRYVLIAMSTVQEEVDKVVSNPDIYLYSEKELEEITVHTLRNDDTGRIEGICSNLALLTNEEGILFNFGNFDQLTRDLDKVPSVTETPGVTNRGLGRYVVKLPPCQNKVDAIYNARKFIPEVYM